ncbi:prepilin-type N-terminal cleavage/methylation domain-containing protein [Candidatus Pelagibacter sp.]|uniref:prepilin-type N-terminal cleavage/methylation domain-containing protein n=1 Tax=Candidatus Pelagibacter sp. TaxID=2024849 RepID=UPI003F82E8F7
MKRRNFKISGLSILEALVSTAIVGIGFIAILQMTNFSVQSIDRSADRTKANYLTEMIAEDVLGSKNALYGIASDSEDLQIRGDGTITLSGGGDASNIQKFSQHLAQNTWSAGLNCQGTTNTATGGAQFQENIYETQEVDAPRNKEAKWNLIFSENRFLKCLSDNETKRLQMFTICRWASCGALQSDSVFDDPLYIGRVEMFLNNGKKKKYLYFQSDYKIKRENEQAPGGQGGGGGMIGTPSG